MFGSAYGELINKIALEKVWYDHNYDGAMSFLKECFEGIDDDTCHKILRKQTKIVILNSTKMDIETENLEEGVNIEDWYYQKVEAIIEDCKGKAGSWKKSITDIVNDCARRLRKGFNIHLDMSDYLYYRNNEEDQSDLFKDLRDFNDDINYYEIVVKSIENDIDKLERYFKITSNLSEDSSKIKIPTIYYLLKDYLNTLTDIEKLKQQCNVAYEMQLNIEKYIDNTLRLDKLIEIAPTFEYCDAGWFDRKGNYYGLNGEIGNFLHIRIADLLVASQIIHPDKTENIDRYLEQIGWIKQHGNQLFYYGYYDDLNITKEQMLTVKKILSQKYSSTDLQGNGRQFPISKLTEIDEIQLRKHFA